MIVSIVIPVYFNEGSISLTFEKVKAVLDSSQIITGYEFIFVDDGSKDNSFIEMQKLHDAYNDIVILVKLSRNFGQVAAIYAGYNQAKGDVIITMSADLQDPPSLIEKMLLKYSQEASPIVICSRMDREEGYFRKITSALFYSAMKKLSFPNMPKGGFDYVLISRKVLVTLLTLNESNVFWQGQILWSGFPISFIPYKRLQREIGESKWTFSKKIKYLLDGILGYSYTPIRFISLMGIIVFVIGLLYSVLILINYFYGNSPFNGWSPIMIVVLLLGGFQLLVLGIIGEYLWRTLDQVRNRPMFVIEDVVKK